MKTLRDIVIPLVTELANNGEQFSAHTVTEEARKSVNLLGDTENLDIPHADLSCDHMYEVDHNDVKDIVNEMYRNGTLQRVFNGKHFVYNGSSTPVIKTPATDQSVKTTNDLVDRIYTYLKRNGRRSVGYIIGSVCRYDQDNRCVDTILATVEKDKRFKNLTPNREKTYQVIELV